MTAKTMIDILVAHQRQNSNSCLCGWAKLGHSHCEHVAAELTAAGFDSKADAKAEALVEAADAGDPQDTSLFLFTLRQRDWLRKRAAEMRQG